MKWRLVLLALLGVFFAKAAVADQIIARPTVSLNGWGARVHVGAYEEGQNQGFNFGLNNGPTLAYTNPANAVDTSTTTFAYSAQQHTHQYSGCVYRFTAVAPTGVARILNIDSEVPANGTDGFIVTARSAGVWYSIDGGTSWVQVYNLVRRTRQTDHITLSVSQDLSKVQVMIFSDSHDDMYHKVYDINISQPVAGYVNPKYVVVGVVYAPPGGKSFVDYTNSNTVSSTLTVTDTSTVGKTTSVSVTQPGGLFGFLGGSRTSTNSTTLTQSNQDSVSVTASFTATSGLQLFGPGQTSPSNNCGPLATDFIGVDHDCDIIKVWVNPVMLFSLANTGAFTWNGYGSSALDPVAPIHVVDILVGCLNGDIAASDSRCAPPLGEFQRTWAASENWPAGQGPGLTQTDLNNILASDPWGQCLPTAAIGSTACPTFTTPGFTLLPPQFTLSSQTNVPYRAGAPQTTYMVSAMNATTQGQKSTTTHTQTYGIEDSFKGTSFLMGFGASVGASQTLTTSFEVENKTTVMNTFTGMVSITGPACNGNPCNPAYPPIPQKYGEGTEFNIFVDNFFGTFVFVPAAYN